MHWKLSLLAVGAVLLASCIGERREAPAERCGELPAASCRDALLVGPGTFPLDTADARVFDVPAGARVQARLIYLGEGVHRASVGRSELARYGLTDSGHFLDADEWILIRDVATGSELRISTLSAEELDRTIIQNRMIVLDYDEGIRQPRLGNLFVDRSKFDTSARFPTDRFWPVPPADDVLARNPVDALFDQILASIRKADP